ncbi:hypothetical protein O6V14_04760 [Sphingomonas faeni]|uniref:hypothetical protein n=1 Tax=Sphingomonas faeni TaxID=185950 RepID=UPI00334B5D39
MKHHPFTTAPKRNPPVPGRDWTLDECRAVADHAMSDQPHDAFFSTDPRALTDAIFAIAGPRVTMLRDVPTITARCVEPDARLVELLAKDAPLTAAEWAEITAFERASA